MAVKVAMMSVTMLLLVAVVARVDARFNFSPILNSMLQQTDNSVKKDFDCCELCICAYSFPAQCRCTDNRPYCFPSCKNCLCNLSNPPQCFCYDIAEDCPIKSCWEKDEGHKII
ncbi:hypothetical protein HHK36_004814 [Tetracentron sinense]|uniref:Bowman-Birk serine protease inhibitors family domain-containing protein n=1 Tax=Tetracentron sinense TaxID=13715 RepID=A0A835D7W4_TETSI|nr:hypothetical protein HHK36_020288 [Tetracentron sinense]KAF8408746.1 hypothetical protein HHK36_004814 [Tetracentron sinense]